MLLDEETKKILNRECPGDGHAAWKRILQMYEKTEILSMVTLLRKLVATTYNDGDDINIYLNTIATYIDGIRNAGAQFASDDFQIACILLGLPESFEPLDN
jgi:hypothetical protein